MQSTLNLKKNSDGIVDGIVADDIGKFPDTNLAEAVQRISGVSIDRTNGLLRLTLRAALIRAPGSVGPLERANQPALRAPPRLASRISTVTVS